MKTETLEALLLDRALGQLTPEVAELLDEHLAQNPAAAARAAALTGTVDLARTAVRVDDDTNIPTLATWPKVERTAWWSSALTQGLRLAACVALGVVVGWAIRRPEPAAPVIAQVHARAVTVTSPSAADAFWINARRTAETAARTPEPRRTAWESFDVLATKEGNR